MLRKLAATFHEKPWGSTRLEPWFSNVRAKAGPFPIGEVWFEQARDIPLLIKFLFTTEKLSVQVHPTDWYAKLHHSSPGKTEMWHILTAEPGAKIAAGFREPVTRDQLREAAVAGTIDGLLQWFDAAPGDTFFIPAGTVHAIGPGLALCEIQQYSDLTYRLHDYGRGRELHLDHSLAVARLDSHQARREMPVSCEYFTTEKITINGVGEINISAGKSQILVALEGEGSVEGESLRAGEALHVSPSSGPIEILGQLTFLRSFAP